MGLDDKTINDDEDAVMELRMMHKVHRLHTFDLATPALSAYEPWSRDNLNGAKASGFADEVGALVPGMRAMRSSSISTGWRAIPGSTRNSTSPTPLWSAPWRRRRHSRYRGKNRGREPSAAHDRREGLYREVREFCAKGPHTSAAGARRLASQDQTLCQAWYRSWHENMLDQPF